MAKADNVKGLRERIHDALTGEMKPTKAQLDAEKGTPAEKHAHASARLRNRAVAELRSAAAVEKFKEMRGKVGKDIPVPAGRGVYIHDLRAVDGGVELLVAGDGDPHFRVFNPPTLVEDPAGDIEIQGKRFREDPVAALGDVVANYRHSETKKGRSR